MKVHILESKNWGNDSAALQGQVKAVVEMAYADARKELPSIPTVTNIIIEPNSWATDDLLLVGGYTHNPEYVYINFDPRLPYGKDRLLSDLRGAVFYELNHAAYFAVVSLESNLPIVEDAIFEGLATVFEREYSGGPKPAMANYGDDETMQKWFAELVDAQKTSKKIEQYKFIHSDGRRWVSYKVGTWIIDQAIKKSGRSVVDLTQISAKEILEIVS